MSSGTSVALRSVHYGVPILAKAFGFPPDTKVPSPPVIEGAITYFLPPKVTVTLEMIINSKLGKEILHPGLSIYEKYNWARGDDRGGYQRILLPVPNSQGKTAAEQMAFISSLNAGWQPAPFLPTLIACMLYCEQSGKNPLGNEWCRTKDQLGNGKHACLAMVGTRIDVAESAPDKAGAGLLMAAWQ